jgi:hypothetical protein
VRSTTAALIAIDASIAFYAAILAALGDVDTEDRRRAKAVLILAKPPQALQLLQAFARHRATTDDTGNGDGETVPTTTRRTPSTSTTPATSAPPTRSAASPRTRQRRSSSRSGPTRSPPTPDSASGSTPGRCCRR